MAGSQWWIEFMESYAPATKCLTLCCRTTRPSIMHIYEAPPYEDYIPQTANYGSSDLTFSVNINESG